MKIRMTKRWQKYARGREYDVTFAFGNWLVVEGYAEQVKDDGVQAEGKA